jgi:hypothetical protein
MHTKGVLSHVLAIRAFPRQSGEAPRLRAHSSGPSREESPIADTMNRSELLTFFKGFGKSRDKYLCQVRSLTVRRPDRSE